MTENGLLNKPSNIFNMDETGLQLNNKPGFVIAQKGSKNVAAITSSEKGETITITSCCNAEGIFIPPVCIFKGKNKKAEFEDNSPPGATVYMNEKSAYINTNLFFMWLKNHFLPRKPSGKVILVLDGHSTHCNSVEMLEFAEGHEIILLCLPGHTTQFLQPLDRSFFKSLKSNFNKATAHFMRTNPTRKITRLVFGKLFPQAWSLSAVAGNAIAGFRAIGIFPLNANAIPDYAFLSDDADLRASDAILPTAETHNVNEIIAAHNDDPNDRSSEEVNETTPLKDTPGTLLNKMHPVTSTSSGIQQARKRSKQVASILTSSNHIQKRKSMEAKKMSTAAVEKSKGDKKVRNTKIKKVDYSSSDKE